MFYFFSDHREEDLVRVSPAQTRAGAALEVLHLLLPRPVRLAHQLRAQARLEVTRDQDLPRRSENVKPRFLFPSKVGLIVQFVYETRLFV